MTESTRKTQVVIIGAGPTGLSMAAQLLRHNTDFIILEKNERTTYLSKALVVQARTLELLNEIGLAEKAVNEGRVTMALNMFYRGKRKAFVNLSGLGEGISPYPFVLSLEQSKTEQLLVQHLLDHGKTIEWNSDFERFSQDENSVTVYYTDRDGSEKIIEADYLVGCDGASSIVRHQSGMSFEGDTVPKIFYVADVVINSEVINTSELFIFLIKKGFILFFPMEGQKHWRIIGILPGATEEETANLSFDDIQDSITQEVDVPIAFEKINWFSHYKVHSRKASSFRNKRCFLAGDAAHIHTPAGGQGMNTGIQDAYNLAWKTALTLRNNADDLLLESYNSERMQNAEHLLQTTDRMFEIMAGQALFADFIRLRVFPFVAGFVAKSPMLNRYFFPFVSQTGITYPDSALTIKSNIGKVKAGDRMHYFVFGNGRNIFDDLTEPAFKLLYFGTGESKFTNDERFQLNVIEHSYLEIPHALFGNETDFYVFLRPDNHISYIGKDLREVGGLLKKITAKSDK